MTSTPVLSNVVVDSIEYSDFRSNTTKYVCEFTGVDGFVTCKQVDKSSGNVLCSGVASVVDIKTSLFYNNNVKTIVINANGLYYDYDRAQLVDLLQRNGQ